MTSYSIVKALAAVSAACLLAGCASAPGPAPRGAAERGGEPAPANRAERLAAMLTSHYLRMDPDRTGLVNAADDGRMTFLAFTPQARVDLGFYDQDGQPLMAARSGAVVAINGVHKGILVRAPGTPITASYVAPNPRANPADRPTLDADPDVVEARNRLEIATTQLPAFRRALARAEQLEAEAAAGQPLNTYAGASTNPGSVMPVNAGGSTAAAANSAAASASQPSGAMLGSTAPGNNVALAKSARGATNQTATADSATYQQTERGVVVRVFFAPNSRYSIVRPDDGLRRLAAEAEEAQEIEIVGYTDSTGSDAANLALAYGRAETIREILIKRGVPPEKIAISAGGRGPNTADNSSEAARAMNRRAEVTLIKRPG